MTQQIDELLMSMTPILNNLTRKPIASFEYHGVSDGLVWSDEMPAEALTDQQEQVIRYIIQYRTGLIIEEPIPALTSLWEQARCAFPNWAGFTDDRCKPSIKLSEYVRMARTNLEQFLEEDS